MPETLDNPTSSNPEVAPAVESFLAILKSKFDARQGSFCDLPSVVDYGQPEEEYRALRETCGLLYQPWLSLVEVTGEDRIRFLNGLITCEIKGLEAGNGTYGFVTSLKGRILSDLTVWVFEDRLWLQIPATVRDEILEHCQKYLIADRVEFKPLVDHLAFSLLGPKSADPLEVVPQEIGQHLEIKLGGRKARLRKGVELGGSSWVFWVTAADAEAVIAACLESPASLRLVGHQAYDRLRIEQGLPLFGRDFDAQNFPQETGFEEAVCYTKGCYLGQEVVARIHYRGGVNRRICGLRIASAVLEGQTVRHEGRDAGYLSSVVESDGTSLGLAILHKRAAQVGTEVELEDGATAKVAALPFR